VDSSRASGEQLTSIIDDILDFSRIEAGQIVIERIPFNLRREVEDVCRVMAFNAHKKDLSLCCRIAPDFRENRLGDPTRLRQILYNLVGNAIKFTGQGHVSVDVETGPAGEALLRVSDTGEGVPKDKQAAIFDVFTQADSTTTRKHGGAGLGLAIVKRLAALMHGDITLSSTENEGATFTVSLPLELDLEAEQTRQTPPPQLQGKSALLLASNALCARNIVELLEEAGVEAVATNDPAEARAMLRHDAPDCLLLDTTLGEGLNLELPPRIKLLALSRLARPAGAMADETLRRGGRRLSLPVFRDELHAALVEALFREAPVSLPGPSAEPELPPLRVLLVDDSESNRFIIGKFLKNAPVELVIAVNGQEAVDAHRGGGFDLVLMDIEMPVMDGFEATRRIRELEASRGWPPAPVLALTAHAFDDVQERCMAVGCTDFLRKPVRKSELLAAMRRFSKTRDA